MNEVKWVVFDCEGDGLTPTKFYCLSYQDHLGEKETLTDYEDIRRFFTEYDWYIGHNIRRWDLPHLNRVIGINIPNNIVDTLFLAFYLEPERKSHSLEGYGEDYGVPKPVIIDWHNQTLDSYKNRCEKDVQINIKLWLDQIDHLMEIYGSFSKAKKFIKYLDFKAYCAHLAEQSKWKLDIEKCETELKKLQEERDRKFEELKAVMPKVPINASRSKPKKMYRNDGSLTSLGERWVERLREAGLPDDYEDDIIEVIGYEDGNPNSHQQLKNWLYSLGWVPQTIKTVRNKKTGELKEIPQINKEAQKGGGVCESVELLYEKEPSLHVLDGYFVLNHRISILSGFLRDQEDGWLTARVAGLTNTLRFKHAELVNLPKPEKPYGKDIRGCLISVEGQLLCGSDMSSLEDRLKQHYLFPYDPDYVRDLQSDNYDPHLALALMAGAVNSEEVTGYKANIAEIVKKIKPIRSIYKNGNYACQYGAGVSRLAITCGCDEGTARRIHEAYWKLNWAIKACAADQEVKTVRNQMWLYNPISGFWYSLRFKKDIFSTLVQGSAVYCFDVWLMFIVKDRPQLTGQFHDEIILDVEEGYATYDEETRKWKGPIVDWLQDKIRQTNEFLELNVELGIDVQFGKNYADIH